MRDLAVIVADADAEALLRAILGRPRALGIRPIDAEVRRLDGRDCGLVSDGPELTRELKARFSRMLLVWDHHGSGWEKHSAEQACQRLQDRSDSVSWRGRSAAVAIDPELEEWIWRCPDAIRKWLEQDHDSSLNSWMAEFAQARGLEVSAARLRYPKELLRFVAIKRWQRQPRTRDYGWIALRASLVDWEESRSFSLVARVLRAWFPPLSPLS